MNGTQRENEDIRKKLGRLNSLNLNLKDNLERIATRYIEDPDNYTDSQMTDDISTIAVNLNSSLSCCDTIMKLYYIVPNTTENPESKSEY